MWWAVCPHAARCVSSIVPGVLKGVGWEILFPSISSHVYEEACDTVNISQPVHHRECVIMSGALTAWKMRVSFFSYRAPYKPSHALLLEAYSSPHHGSALHFALPLRCVALRGRTHRL
jgi:hypothetical protein